jgi:aminopeptidase N
VLAKYTTTIVANKAKYPVLLSNGTTRSSVWHLLSCTLDTTPLRKQVPSDPWSHVCAGNLVSEGQMEGGKHWVKWEGIVHANGQRPMT